MHQQVRHITSLRAGEAGWIPGHAAWVEGTHMYVNGDYPVRDHFGGTFTIRLVKTPLGRLLVDLSQVGSASLETRMPFGEDVIRVKVDEALQPPAPDPWRRRIYDMKVGETAYISPGDVWVYENVRMWLNGYTPVAAEISRATPLRITRWQEGFVVDLASCQVGGYPSEPSGDVPMYPIQVYRRVG